ncbi:hypothetical protein PCASD_23102 [Puccinia coronata f. sp. avenae]|uniref:EamA domain-containing protein n=1 Tax=Puccinia coronata f. sp. avenae TaxID=200324 RepID=A0A2N5SCN9_9BASI|nr:hypothetical protein PCASD_23102 [Puccinia coronata f. sp. avenae]
MGSLALSHQFLNYPWNLVMVCCNLACLLRQSFQLTLFLALPFMCWYSAVPFADMTSITSIFNTNGCFTYLFAVLLIRRERFESRKTLAILSVLVITYSKQSASNLKPSQNPGAHLCPLGILLALLGSISYALFKVWYKSFNAWSNVSLGLLCDNRAQDMGGTNIYFKGR